MRRARKLIRILALILVTLVILPPAPAAAATTVTTFDVTKGELPEGITFDRRGSLYVSLAPLGEIRRRGADGTWSKFATIGPDPAGGLSILGLAAGPRGKIYAAAPTGDPRWHGVLAISKTGDVRRIPGSEAIQFPNAIAVGPGGDLYLTDSIGGSIWRIPRGGEAELWLQHDLLEGTGVVNPFPLGANGIAYRRGRLYVANTEKMHVVEIPIGRHQEAGEPKIRHAFTGPTDFLDGIAVDPAGNLYVLLVVKSELVRIDRRGQTRTLADASDELNIPASLTFGVRRRAHRTLYITNLAAPDLTSTPNPAVIAVRVPPPRRSA
jgi:sugar lactone lactonase YvrE